MGLSVNGPSPPFGTPLAGLQDFVGGHGGMALGIACTVALGLIALHQTLAARRWQKTSIEGATVIIGMQKAYDVLGKQHDDLAAVLHAVITELAAQKDLPAAIAVLTAIRKKVKDLDDA